MSGQNVEIAIAQAVDVVIGDDLLRPPVDAGFPQEPVDTDRPSQRSEAHTRPFPPRPASGPGDVWAQRNYSRPATLQPGMMLVIAVDPAKLNSELDGQLLDVVEPSLLTAGPQPEVTELEHHRAGGSRGSVEAHLRPLPVAVPVAGQEDALRIGQVQLPR